MIVLILLLAIVSASEFPGLLCVCHNGPMPTCQALEHDCGQFGNKFICLISGSVITAYVSSHDMTELLLMKKYGPNYYAINDEFDIEYYS